MGAALALAAFLLLAAVGQTVTLAFAVGVAVLVVVSGLQDALEKGHVSGGRRGASNTKGTAEKG